MCGDDISFQTVLADDSEDIDYTNSSSMCNRYLWGFIKN